MDEWESTMKKLKTSLGRNIEDILRVGYESLDENEQTIFLHIAVFFNYEGGDLVKAMFAGTDLDVKSGLKILVNRSFIEISGKRIEMHKLLQLVGRQAIQRQEPWKRRILIEGQEICDVLENDTGTSSVSGISFDISRIDEVSISARAFRRMHNLRFLRVYGRRVDGNSIMLIPDEIEFPRRLRLLRLDAYPNKCLPATIHLECLVKLDMRCSKLEKLWQGTQSLTNLKWVDLKCSSHLKELPDLSKAINLKELDLSYCTSLVELPSSVPNLRELITLSMKGCTKLELIPANWNLPSLFSVDIKGTSITILATIPPCGFLNLGENGKLKTLPQVPEDILILDLSYSGIERLSNCCITSLCFLSILSLSGCRKLAQLPELPASLRLLDADDCESLETIFSPLNAANAQFNFMNCFRLSQEARREIIQQRSFGDWSSRLPGSEMPEGFHHRAIGDTLTFPLSAFSSFKVCLVISPIEQFLPDFFPRAYCRRMRKGYLYPAQEMEISRIPLRCPWKHLYIFHSELLQETGCLEVRGEIVLEFSSRYFDVIECGVQILMYETDGSNNGDSGDEDAGSDHRDTHESGEEADEDEEDDHVSIVDKRSEDDEEDYTFLSSEAYKDEDEGYESESGEAYKDEDEGIADVNYEYLLEKPL